MWRKCDLHRHTTPDVPGEFDFHPKNFLMECVSDGLDVVAVTDHDRTNHIDAVMEEARNHDIIVVPGAEISTDRGHVIALAPGGDGRIILDELCGRVPVTGSTTVEFSRSSVSFQSRGSTGRCLSQPCNAHRSPRGPTKLHPRAQSSALRRRSALECAASTSPRSGQRTDAHNLAKRNQAERYFDGALTGSDAHPTVEHETRATWIYLPEVTLQCLRHAFATHESSISHEQHPPPEPEFWIRAIRFDGGQYDGRRIEFSPRANALIGPPSSGKSLIVDAIRYVFDMQCAIIDVQSSIERRLVKCLPDGTAVTIELESSGGDKELRRVPGRNDFTRGGGEADNFSQAELARRSMEPMPSVELLDIHCPQGEVHKLDIKEISGKVCSAFREVVNLATQARDLHLEVENEQEGLEATRGTYLNLVGDEETAKSLGELGRIETWHKVAKQRLEDWRNAFQIPAGPELPAPPQLQTGLPITDYVPSNAIPKALNKYKKAVGRAANEIVATLRTESNTRLPKVESLRGDIQASLGDEQHATPELAVEAERYRTRLSKLEQQATDLAAIDERINDDLKAIDTLIDQASTSWAALRNARQWLAQR